MVDRNVPLRETAAGEAVNIELARQKKIYRENLEAIAADYEKETQGMKALIDEERSKLESGLQQLEADKLMMMSEQRRAEEAAKAGKEEEFLKLAQERQKMETKFQQKMKELGREKDAVAQKLAKLAAIKRHEEEKAKMRKEESGFWTSFLGILGVVVAVLAVLL